MKGTIQSKTVWYALLTSVLGAYLPGVSDFVANNPELYVVLNGIAVIILRALTKKAIKIL